MSSTYTYFYFSCKKSFICSDESITLGGDKKSIELEAKEKVKTSYGDLSILNGPQTSEDKDNCTRRSKTAKVSTSVMEGDNGQTACDTLTENYLVPGSAKGSTHSSEFVLIANKYMTDKLNKLQQEGGQSNNFLYSLKTN